MSVVNNKPRYVAVTDPTEIESARRNGALDLIAVERGGAWWALKSDLERWRSWQTREPVNGGV